MAKTGYVVLAYGNQNLLLKCLQTFRIFHTDDPLVVADNGGPDGALTKELTERFGGKYICNPLNDSLSKLMNMGVDACDADYVCIVTSGVEFTTRLSEQFNSDFERDPLTVMVGGLLFYPDGKIQHGGGRRFWNYNAMGHYGQGKYPYQAKLCTIPAYRIYVTGATAAIRKEFWQDHKYNESLTMSCEDTDICLQAWQSGKRVYYDPLINSIHKEGSTRGATPEEKMKKAPWALAKEKASLKLFQEKYNDADFLTVDKEVNRLNKELHPTLPIAVIRNGATGDVLRLLNLYKKYCANTILITQVPEAFRNAECLAITNQVDEYAVSEFIDLDMAYERRRDLSIEQAYESVLIGKEDGNNKPVDLKTTAFDWYAVKMIDPNFDWDKPFVVMHFGTGWPGKVLPFEFWQEISLKIAKKGFNIISIGRGNDYGVNGPGAIDLVNKTSIHMLRALMEHAKLYVGNDSGPLHVADGACPAIGLFMVTTPEKVVSDQVTGMMTQAPCSGCQLRRPLATSYGCEFPDGDMRQFMCNKMFQPDEVVAKAYELLGVK